MEIRMVCPSSPAASFWQQCRTKPSLGLRKLKLSLSCCGRAGGADTAPTTLPSPLRLSLLSTPSAVPMGKGASRLGTQTGSSAGPLAQASPRSPSPHPCKGTCSR